MAEKQTSKDRMREIVDSIENGIKELFESDKYQQYLSTMSRFHRYSVIKRNRGLSGPYSWPPSCSASRSQSLNSWEGDTRTVICPFSKRTAGGGQSHHLRTVFGSRPVSR